MPGKREPRNNDGEVLRLELSAAIREAGSSGPLDPETLLETILYLDPDLTPDTANEGDNRTLVRCVSALVALFYLAIYLWLRHCVR